MLIVSRNTTGIQLRPEDLRRPLPSLPSSAFEKYKVGFCFDKISY